MSTKNVSHFDNQTWGKVSAIVHRVVRSGLRFAPLDDVDEVANAAIGATFQNSRATAVDNVEALATTIAKRAVINYLRSRKIAEARVRPLTEGDADVPVPEPVALTAETAEWLLFLVASYFAREKPDCTPILELKRREVESWAAKTEFLGGTAGALKQRWSRCCASFRRWAAANGIRPFSDSGAE